MPPLMKRALISARLRLDRVVVPPRNRRLEAAFAADPQAWLARVDAAIDRGVAWIAPQRDVSMSVLLCAQRTLQRTGDSRFGYVVPQLERYVATLRDPATRVVLPGYDPADPRHAHLPDVMEVRPYHPVELLMLDAVWAGVRAQPDILQRLVAFDDEGFYGTTHIIVGGLVLLMNGGAPADRVRAAIEATLPAILARNATSPRADDIFAERIMVLQWIDRHALIPPSWILRLLDAQRPDGGWASWNMPPVGLSNQHTVAVALAALAEFLAARRGHLRPGWGVPGP
ncbi:hypothetical protein V8J36_04125 [Frigidibacter sp. MR17.14]|uniref:hypothetical protein n=1 Tax=Frigidibacter sp. MR17.14 TaxID=3126509 RepID=UPI0030131252